MNFIPAKDRILIKMWEPELKTQLILPGQEKGELRLNEYKDHPYIATVVASGTNNYKEGDVIMLDSYDTNRVEHVNILGDIYILIKEYQVLGTRIDLMELVKEIHN